MFDFKKCLTAICLLLILFVFSSCDSPTDVQANRIKIENKKSGNGLFEITPQVFLMNNLIYNKEYEAVFAIKNLTDKSLTFKELKFKHQPQSFRINSEQDIILAPAGQSGDENFISVFVKPKLLGTLSDTLLFDSYFEPYVSFSAMVPTIYTGDVDFGIGKLGQTKYKTIDIYNFGEQIANIKSINIIGDEGIFKIENFNPESDPIYIYPGGVAKQLIVSFKPLRDIQYETKFELEIETSNSGFIDAISTVRGLGR